MPTPIHPRHELVFAIVMEREWLKTKLVQGGSYEAIARELGCSPSKVAYWDDKHGLRSDHAERPAPRGPIAEVFLRALASGRSSIREITETMDRSSPTIRPWLSKLGLETDPV